LPEGAAGDSPTSWRLLEIALERCVAERLGGDPTRPKSVDQDDFTISASFSDEVLGFLVSSNFAFLDEDDEHVASVEVEYSAAYIVGKEPPSQDDVSDFQKSVVLQVVPFMREVVISMTAHMGIPRFFMPLMRKTEIKISAAPDSRQA
jgi:hypothetical protein